MSTVVEIKEAARRLRPQRKAALAKWLRSQVDDQLTDDAMMAIAAEGARALDKREATYAAGKKR